VPTRLGIVTLAILLVSGFARAELNLFEWTAVAPIVVEGEVLGEEGRNVVLHVGRVFRGEVETSTNIRINVKHANRNRSRNADFKALKLKPGGSYVMLLQDGPRNRDGSPGAFLLARGVRGARETPDEGFITMFAALEQFIEIQDRKSEQVTWRRFGEMLEQRNPILLQTALDQFLKFHRGNFEVLFSVRPLLDHPDHEIRERAARLIGQIITHRRDASVPEESALRSELIASARRDRSIPVRMAATEALGQFHDGRIVEVLEEIADTDPEQEVRYTAEKLLYERRLDQARRRD